MNVVCFEYQPKAIAALEAAIVAAVEAGAERVILDLNGLPALDSTAARGLIVLLRRAREVGGELALRADRPEIRRTLQVMAFDRLFPMVVGVAA